MMRKLVTLLVPLMVALATPALAENVNTWRVPGHCPYAPSREVALDEARLRIGFRKAGLTGRDIDTAVAATRTKGEMRDLVDGERFDAQLYCGQRVIRNVEVAFRSGQNRTAERWRATLADGRQIEITRPDACNNISIVFIRRPRPKPPCYRIPMKYSSNAQVTYRTASALQAAGRWNTSEEQAFMYPNAPYAFVSVHIDVTDAEMVDMIADKCFGYGDMTGFHREVDYCAEFCIQGSYPNPGILNALATRRAHPVALPAREPDGSFRIPLANGEGYLSLPLRYADRFVLPCIEVVPYHLTLESFTAWRSVSHFDVVTAEQGRFSLVTNHREEGDIVLVDRQRAVRRLYGELQF
jgi:hypothetical protein